MTDWNKAFADSECSITIQNMKPPHETARNLFQEDRKQIMAAAEANGFKMLGDGKARVISFVRK